MNTHRIGRDSRAEIDRYRAEIKELKKTRGGELFSGYTINWMTVVGFDNFFKLFNEHYRAALREEFFDHLKNLYSRDVRTDSQHILDSSLKDIMLISEMHISEANKMELILLLIKGREALKIVKMEGGHETYLQKAKQYFEKRKKEAMEAIDQIGGGLPQDLKNKEKLDKLRKEWDKKEIKSEEELKKFEQEYAEKVIDKLEKMYRNERANIEALQTQIDRFYRKAGMPEAGIFLKIPGTTSNQILKTLKDVHDRWLAPLLNESGYPVAMKSALGEIHQEFTRNIDSSKDLLDFKKNYINAVIVKMMELSMNDGRIIGQLLKIVNDDELKLDEKKKNELKKEIVKIQVRPFLAKYDLREEEKKEFLEKYKDITDYDDLKDEFYVYFPMFHIDNRGCYKKFKEFKDKIHEAHVDEDYFKPVISKIEMEKDAKSVVTEIKNNIRNSAYGHSFKVKTEDMPEQDLDEALLLYVFEVRRDLAIAEKDRKAFFEKYPKFKFILDKVMFDDFETAISQEFGNKS